MPKLLISATFLIDLPSWGQFLLAALTFVVLIRNTFLKSKNNDLRTELKLKSQQIEALQRGNRIAEENLRIEEIRHAKENLSKAGLNKPHFAIGLQADEATGKYIEFINKGLTAFNFRVEPVSAIQKTNYTANMIGSNILNESEAAKVQLYVYNNRPYEIVRFLIRYEDGENKTYEQSVEKGSQNTYVLTPIS